MMDMLVDRFEHGSGEDTHREIPMVTTSVTCFITEDRTDQRAGAIVYEWDGEGRQFPDDVVCLYIRMPVTWRDECRLRGEAEDGLDSDYADTPVPVGWATSHPKNHGLRNQWKLSGTVDTPTLSPSLHWVGVWHGFLTDGHLKSC